MVRGRVGIGDWRGLSCRLFGTYQRRPEKRGDVGLNMVAVMEGEVGDVERVTKIPKRER